MNQHEHPALLARAIGNSSELVTAVSYEYPDTWLIKTTKGEFFLGDVNGYFAWHDEDGKFSGETSFNTARSIALAFSVWLDQIGGN
jgi:hypothetical protein